MPLNRLSGPTVLFIAGIAVIMLAAVLAYDQVESRRQAIELNIRHIEQNDRMLAEHVARSLDSVNILLDEMRFAIQGRRGWQNWSPADGHQLLKSRLSRSLPQVRHLLIFDAEGNQRHTSFDETPPRINVRDRPYFMQLAQGAEKSYYGPYVGRNSNRPTYAIARRLGEDRFEGVLMVGIEPSYYEELCRASRPHGDFETALVNAAGRIVSLCRSINSSRERSPANTGDDFRLAFGNGEFARQSLPMNRSVTTGERFVLTTEPVPGHADLRVVSLTPRELLTREWRSQAIRTFLLAGLALITLIVSGGLIRRHLRQLATLASQLRQSHETLEHRVEVATRELDSRRNEALRLAEAKTRFFAAASHDLRQPLHAQQLFLADLARMPLSPEQRVLVDRLQSATHSIADQLRSLLDISRLDMANITPERRLLTTRELFAQLSETYSPSATATGIRLVFRPRGAALETDPALLARLVGNLIDNAIKFSHGGTVLVCARWRINAVCIEVRDNGCGIAPEHQAEIFDEFFQIENRARDPNAGLGLGLAIASRIARLLGTGIVLRSIPEKGSVFSITLPCLTGKASTAVHAGDSTGMPQLILIGAGADTSGGDTDPTAFAERARRWGYSVSVAPSIASAWRTLDAERCIPVVLHGGSCRLPAEIQSLLRCHPGILITGADCTMPEIGPYHLHEPVKPARLRALLRSLH